MVNRILCVLLIFAARPVLALDDLDLDNGSSDVMSLNYYPHRRVFDFNPRINTEFHDETTTSIGETTEISRNYFTVVAGYGILEGLRFHILESLLWDQIGDHFRKKIETKTPSNGASNPTFSLAWRWLENPDSGFSADVGVNYSPSFGAHRIGDGSIDQDGNFLSGNTVAGGTIAVFWRKGFNEVELAYSANHVSQTTTVATLQVSTEISDAYWLNAISLSDRIHLSLKFYAEIGAVSYSPVQFNSVTASNIHELDQQEAYVLSHVQFGYCPDPDMALMLTLQYNDTNSSVQNVVNGNSISSENSAVIGIVSLLTQF